VNQLGQDANQVARMASNKRRGTARRVPVRERQQRLASKTPERDSTVRKLLPARRPLSATGFEEYDKYVGERS
jgi:hypothetical protein